MESSTGKSKSILNEGESIFDKDSSQQLAHSMVDQNNRDRLSFLERKLEIFKNSTEESFVLIDRSFKIISFNKQFNNKYKFFFGVNVQKGNSILDYVLPNQLETTKAIYEKVFKGEFIDREVEIRQSDESCVFLLIRYKPALDESGLIIGAFVISIDVTEKKKWEQEILLKEKRLRALLDNSVDVVTILTPELKPTYISSSVERVLGYTEEEAMNMCILTLLHPEDYQCIQKSINNAERLPGIPVSVPVGRYRHKNGDWRYMEATVTNLLHEPSIMGIIQNLWDVTSQKLAEQQKEFERVDKEALINSTEDLIWSVGKDFKLIAGNKAFIDSIRNSTGKIVRPGDDLLLKDFFSLDYLLFWEELYRKTLSGNAHKEELLIPAKENKDEIWHEIRFNPIYNNEHLVGIACYARNITEQKKSEKIIIKEKEFSDSIINALPGIFYLFDSNGKFLRWNKNFETVSGYSSEEISMMTPDQFFEGEEKKYIIERIKKVFENGTSDAEAHFVSKNGTRSPYYFSGSSAVVNEKPCLIGMGIDISERKKAEELVLKINAQLHTAHEIAQLGYWENDVVNNKGYWSDEMYKICDIPFDEEIIPRETFAKIVHPDDKNTHRDGFAFSLENKPLKTSEIRILCKDGSVRHVLILSATVVDKDGKVTTIVGTMQDITKLKENERTLIELNQKINKRVEELAISNAELEQFAYIASHDLQEPLRMVTGFLTQLEKKYQDQLDDKAQQYIHFATDGAIRMRKIILDLLEYSRVGKKDYEFEEIDMNELVQETVHFRQAIIEEAGAVVHCENLPVIYGSKTPIHQVLHNLISNALKYHKNDTKPVITISSEDSLTHWKFSVSDNGIGIDSMFFDKIFVLFQRLHNKDEFSGTGIGLAICKKIVEYHQGKIWVESELGNGSTFYFTISKFFKKI
jgi:PAS domain S-box-containing protein